MKEDIILKKLNKPMQVDTPNGKKTFNGIARYIKNVLEIETEQGKIEVAEKHIFVIDNTEVFAKDLKIGDKLQTKKGYAIVSNIEFMGKKEVFDLTNVDGEVYYTNGFLSHNTFVGSSFTLISADALKRLEAKKPIDIIDGKLNIYHEYTPGNQYICSVDPAKDGTDGFVVNFVDITGLKFKQVATANLDIDYLLMPAYLDDWCRMYGNPYLIIENNEGAGQSVTDQMVNTYEYDNIHYDINKNVKNNVKARKKYSGTRTTKTTRNQILKTMKTFIENGHLEINDEKTINQLFRFVLIDNKYQAENGEHDDCVMSLALAFTLFNNVKNFSDMKAVSDSIKSDLKTKDPVNIAELITIGSFDQTPEIQHNSTDITFEGFDADSSFVNYNEIDINEFG